MEPVTRAPCQVVISQSMYFPWVGVLEQIRLADIYVHYDDVQYARGFYNRVQVKTAHGVKWISVPLLDQRRGQKIDEVLVDDRLPWKNQHRELLRQAYFKAPFRDEMLALVDEVFAMPLHTLGDVSRESTLALARYFDLISGRRFLHSSAMGVEGASSERLLGLTQAVGGTVYITGHGARNYLDHEIFEKAAIDVRYMRYAMTPYEQLHGEFTPFVTGLDLVAHMGAAGREKICSAAIGWKEFINATS